MIPNLIHKTASPIFINCSSAAKISCYTANLTLWHNRYRHLHEAINKCIAYNLATMNFTVEASQFIICSNTTEIKNRTMWGDYLWISVQTLPQDATPQIVHIPRTCTNVSIAAPQKLIHFNISFPPLLKCNRRCHAWYNTLLGGLGSGFGIANSIDLEALAYCLQNTGSDVS